MKSWKKLNRSNDNIKHNKTCNTNATKNKIKYTKTKDAEFDSHHKKNLYKIENHAK